MVAITVIGDSLTVEGYNVSTRSTWPVLLQGKLSDRDVVTVHGRGSLTLANTSLDRIDATWVGHTQQYARALQLDAHIVVICLGTNDCRWSVNHGITHESIKQGAMRIAKQLQACCLATFQHTLDIVFLPPPTLTRFPVRESRRKNCSYPR